MEELAIITTGGVSKEALLETYTLLASLASPALVYTSVTRPTC